MRSKVNLSRIARAASCCGVTNIICIGSAKLDAKIARDAVDTISIQTRRSLPPVLEQLRADRYRLVGLEQATNSLDLHHYAFDRRLALVVGNERLGLSDEILNMLDEVVEIPIWGLPWSYNVATAVTMALYEYCRQFPDG